MSAPGRAGSPAASLEAAYRAVRAERMRGLPFVNEALEVEAVGFAPWDAHWLGVLVTPWCMNLMLLPRDASRWRSVVPGDKLAYRFPAGVYEFVSGRERTIGEFQACSLFSPMFEFADQPAARLTAEAALAALFDPAHAPQPARTTAPMSKRDFLRGAVTGGDREPRG
jgi:[NiFe] hydrogenase assembly HybE family chaperone